MKNLKTIEINIMMWVSSRMEGNKQDGKRVIEL
jgi:hypothetical protein